jgi:hypothetical protein
MRKDFKANADLENDDCGSPDRWGRLAVEPGDDKQLRFDIIVGIANPELSHESLDH